MDVKQFIRLKGRALKLYLYRYVYIPARVRIVRRKKCINVLFVIANIGAWKSEDLYIEMLAHPRFKPILLVVKNDEEDNRDDIKRYLEAKGYNYEDSERPYVSFWNQYHPDIIFYQKPYGGEFINNLKSLFCYIPYAVHGSIEDWSIRLPYIYNCWQVYYENETLAKQYSKLLGRGIHNSFATGLPVVDELMIPKEELENPWKGIRTKKRIIYAPHHSINQDNWWQTSTFLKMGEQILELAEKYSDKVQWAFKPHPLLRGKLEKVWGKEKTDAYYERWTNVEWSQFENGKYLGLFKYSDAMIHDCGSFIEEYMCSSNPVMYLLRDKNYITRLTQTFNDTMTEAFYLHEFGSTIEEVETFITTVISGEVDGKDKRLQFVTNALKSPNGKTAAQNIIDCILYKKVFKAY